MFEKKIPEGTVPKRKTPEVVDFYGAEMLDKQ